MLAKRVYVGNWDGSRSIDRSRIPWYLETVKDCLKKRGLDVRQARKMVHDRSVLRGFVRGNAWGIARVLNIDFDEMPQT